VPLAVEQDEPTNPIDVSAFGPLRIVQQPALVPTWPDSKSESKREPWPRDAYEKTTSQVHEGLAQLLTYLTVGRFNVHHSRTFETLVESQSPDYQAFRDVLAVTDDENRLLRSLVQLRLNPDGATMSEWLAILR
jgi:hypothetical protein